MVLLLRVHGTHGKYKKLVKLEEKKKKKSAAEGRKQGRGEVVSLSSPVCRGEMCSRQRALWVTWLFLGLGAEASAILQHIERLMALHLKHRGPIKTGS